MSTCWWRFLFFCPFEAGLICIGISVLSEIPWISSSHEAFGMIYGGSQLPCLKTAETCAQNSRHFFVGRWWNGGVLTHESWREYRKTCPWRGWSWESWQPTCLHTPFEKNTVTWVVPQKNNNRKTIATQNQTSFSMGKEHHQSLVFGLDSNPVKENLILSQGNPHGNEASLRAYFSL